MVHEWAVCTIKVEVSIGTLTYFARTLPYTRDLKCLGLPLRALRCGAPQKTKFQISSLHLLFIITVHGRIALPFNSTEYDFSHHFSFVLLSLPLLLTFLPLFPHRLTVGRNGRREDANSSELRVVE